MDEIKTRLIKRPNELYAEFLIEGIEPHIINMFRRAVLAYVPTLAIHEVIIRRNTSVLWDEDLALRLALIPLKVDRREIDLLGKCGKLILSLERAVECSARLRLRKRGEPNRIITVYARDIEPVDKKTVRPVYPDIPIVKLGPKQEIDIEMIAKVGLGRDHAKFQAVCTVGYKPLPILQVKENCNGCGKCVEACPKKVLELRNGKPVIKEDKRLECDLDRLCVMHCPVQALEIIPDETKYLFRVESVGQLSLEEIFIAAVNSMDQLMDYFMKALTEALQQSKG